MYINLKIKDLSLRPIFSGHETFSMRYGWLKKVLDESESYLLSGEGEDIRSFFTSDKAIVKLGVGKNMVSSMRHWATYTNIFTIDENKKTSINSFAQWLLGSEGKDPWLENISTLWYIHWNLVCHRKNKGDFLFIYHWFFNYCNLYEFNKEALFNDIMKFLKEYFYHLKPPSILTLERDIDCFLIIYSIKTRRKLSLDEEIIDSPLLELNLVKPTAYHGYFKLNRGTKPSISIYTFLFALFMFWKEYSPNSKSMSFESLCYQPLSPGKVFLLNEDSVSEYMQNVSDVTKGLLEYSETAGMKEIQLTENVNFEKEAYSFLKRNY